MFLRVHNQPCVEPPKSKGRCINLASCSFNFDGTHDRIQMAPFWQARVHKENAIYSQG